MTPKSQILVRGEARDFDDIYEGTPLEAIAKREELMAILARRFSTSKWVKSPEGKNKWIGSSTLSPIICELLVSNQDNAVMLSIDGAEPEDVIAFSKEIGLGIFD